MGQMNKYFCSHKKKHTVIVSYLFCSEYINIFCLFFKKIYRFILIYFSCSGGRYMVYETGAQGIVVSGLLERLGGN